ncbi:MAG: cytochrome c [Rhodospirillales bacterium]|nr:cytochrome c [Rhodospirillales bacterium]MDH3917003.1 cytochrome c [Rhodospirillales bacterium]MDH3968402.1 cytochrome c [Rhodospirillales bacterium]
MGGALRLLVPVCAALLVSGASPAGTAAAEPNAIARGKYVLHAAGCVACHTDEKGGGTVLAGGRALVTPFGTFYTPNITPDPGSGLGGWTEADFLRALGEGRDLQGRPYYPAFPFTSYRGMTEQDMKDLWAYLRSVPPADRANKPHELGFPYSLRFLADVWQWLYFEPAAFRPDPDRSNVWNRGAYLVRHLGHCAECHSPRGRLGALDLGRELAGNPEGPDGKKVPNITPHAKDGIGGWSGTDIAFFLKTGFLPDGDVAGGAMEDVIRESTSRLSDEDRAAIAAYVQSLPAVPGP